MNQMNFILFVLVNSRTLVVCTRIGRTLGLCPNIFSTNSSIDENLLRQGITSSDEQVKRKRNQLMCLSLIELDLS